MCRLCGETDSDNASLKRHIFTVHLNYQPYKCKYCSFAAVTPRSTELHLLQSHPQEPPRIIRLRYKGTLPDIPATIPGHDNVPSEIPENTPIIVPLLSEDDMEDKKPVFAEDWKPGDPFPGTVPDIPIEEIRPSVTVKSKFPTPTHAELIQESVNVGKKLFRCSYCGYTSKWGIKDVKTHIFTTHEKKYPYMCIHCTYGSRHDINVKKHMIRSHPHKPKNVRYLFLEYENTFVNVLFDRIHHVALYKCDLPTHENDLCPTTYGSIHLPPPETSPRKETLKQYTDTSPFTKEHPLDLSVSRDRSDIDYEDFSDSEGNYYNYYILRNLYVYIFIYLFCI